jgi:5-oxoprolinase (ATP-hydrolysing) subunit A
VIDFNADLGESFGLWERGYDEALMRVISSANVACGFHAGDPGAMRRAVASARGHGVAVGAHPGLPDLIGFGRRAMNIAPDDVHDLVLYQVAALEGFARGLHHVKPHGALYVMALDDAAIARAIAEAVAEFQAGLPVYTLAGSELWHACQAAGTPPVAEFFADRPLQPDGTVVMFGWQPLFDPTPEAVAARVRSLLETGTVPALDGTPVAVEASTVCVHSDTPGADQLGAAVRAVLGPRQVSLTGGGSRV